MHGSGWRIACLHGQVELDIAAIGPSDVALSIRGDSGRSWAILGEIVQVRRSAVREGHGLTVASIGPAA